MIAEEEDRKTSDSRRLRPDNNESGLDTGVDSN